MRTRNLAQSILARLRIMSGDTGDGDAEPRRREEVDEEEPPLQHGRRPGSGSSCEIIQEVLPDRVRRRRETERTAERIQSLPRLRLRPQPAVRVAERRRRHRAGTSDPQLSGISQLMRHRSTRLHGLSSQEVDCLVNLYCVRNLPPTDEATQAAHLYREILRHQVGPSLPPWGAELPPYAPAPQPPSFLGQLTIDVEWHVNYTVILAYVTQFQYLPENVTGLPERKLVKIVGATADRQQINQTVPERITWGIFRLFTKLRRHLQGGIFTLRTRNHVVHSVLFNRQWWPTMYDFIHRFQFWFVRTPPLYGWGNEDHNRESHYSPMVTPSNGFIEGSAAAQGSEEELLEAARRQNEAFFSRATGVEDRQIDGNTEQTRSARMPPPPPRARLPPPPPPVRMPPPPPQARMPSLRALLARPPLARQSADE